MSRICIIRHYYYPEDPRGRREAEALAEAGHYVDVIALRHPGESPHEVINGVHVRRLPVEHYRRSIFHYAYEYSAFLVLAFLVATARHIRRPYEVVQVNSLPDFLVFAAAGCKLLGARIVLDMHECTPELFCTKYGVTSTHPAVRVLAAVEQRCLAFADQVVTCTPQQRAVFASRGTRPEKIAVVLNAANSAIFRPRTLEPVIWEPGGPFELVAHGLVVERYGLDTMVRAVALLAPEIPGIVLHVYGKGDYLPELQKLACTLGVAGRVIAHGFVPEEELLEGLARAHVGVIAAKRDAFRDLTQTQKMYEYVAMRKPVVIAETPAIRTHFDDSCFQFFTSGDHTDLVRALRELYYDPRRALEMIDAASCRYRRYSWEEQRHVYCKTVLRGVSQPAPAGIAIEGPIPHLLAVPNVPDNAHAPEAPHVPRVPVVPDFTSVMDTALSLPAMDISGMVASIEEESI